MAFATTTTLYQRLGGRLTIAAVANEFCDRVSGDGRLEGFFRGVNVDRLCQQMLDFLCDRFGGGSQYRGSEIRKVHAPMRVSGPDFDRVACHLVAAFRNAGVKTTLIDDVVSLLDPLRTDIVTAGGGGAGSGRQMTWTPPAHRA